MKTNNFILHDNVKYNIDYIFCILFNDKRDMVASLKKKERAQTKKKVRMCNKKKQVRI